MMRKSNKYLLLYLLSCICVYGIYAQESSNTKCESCRETKNATPTTTKTDTTTNDEEDNTTAFQVTLIGDDLLGSSEGYYEVNGIKIGLIVSGGDGIVNGLELAPFSCFTSTVRGIQTSVFANFAKKLGGLQAGLVNMVSESEYFPVQLGIFNHSKGGGLQFGLLNSMPNGALPFMILVNYSSGN